VSERPPDSPFGPPRRPRRSAPAPAASRSAGAAPPGPWPRRPGWIVVAAALVVIAFITFNTLRTEGPGSTGPAPGSRLPPFAAPLADSTLEGDANVATAAGQGDAGAVPACAVDDPRALNICTLARRGPVVLAFLTVGATACERALDALERLRRRLPQVGFAAVGVRAERDALRRLVRTRRWGFPVALDRDGAVANRYGVAVCPTIVLAYRGGEVMETVLGEASGRALERRVRALLAGPARRDDGRAAR